MKKIKNWLQKVQCSYDERRLYRNVDKLANAIWKYALKDSQDPKFTKKDAETLSMAIHWNDADDVKKILSYTDEFGDRIFPR